MSQRPHTPTKTCASPLPIAPAPRGAQQRRDAGRPDELAFFQGPQAALDRFRGRTHVEPRADVAIATALHARQIADLGVWADDVAAWARRAKDGLSKFKLELRMPDGFVPPKRGARCIAPQLVKGIYECLADASNALGNLVKVEEELREIGIKYAREAWRPVDLRNRAFTFALNYYWERERHKDGRKPLNATDLVLLARGCRFEGPDPDCGVEPEGLADVDDEIAKPEAITGRDFGSEQRCWRDRLREARSVTLDLDDPRTILPEALAVYVIEMPSSDADRAAIEADMLAQEGGETDE